MKNSAKYSTLRDVKHRVQDKDGPCDFFNHLILLNSNQIKKILWARWENRKCIHNFIVDCGDFEN
jgi:hypothetical protein